jgi:hypothetical protein
MSRIPALLLLAAVASAIAAARDPARAEGPARKKSGHGSITEGLDCAACHSTAGWKVAGEGLREEADGAFDHSRTGFPLTGRHAYVACNGCHEGEQETSRECSHCHRDAHARRLGDACDDCHNAQSFREVRAIALHARTRLPLTGMHALADCTECHRATGPRAWSSVPADCFACHAADYRRSDVHPRHTGGVGDPPSGPFSHACGTCHRATAWTPAFVPVGTFDDGTGASASGLRLDRQRHELVFPIAHGVHRDARCEDCHGAQRVAQAVRCTGCHAHAPMRLRSAHADQARPPRDGSCVHCHAGGAVR